jgi:hypothetical protein
MKKIFLDSLLPKYRQISTDFPLTLNVLPNYFLYTSNMRLYTKYTESILNVYSKSGVDRELSNTIELEYNPEKKRAPIGHP